VISGVPDRTVREGDPISIRLQAMDPNGDSVRFQSPNLPAGATLNPLTGLFEWTPGFTQAGRYDIAFWATDGALRSETFFRVEVLNVNGAPVFDALENWVVLEGQPFSFRAFPFDPDNPDFVPPDRLLDGTLTDLIGSESTVSVSVEGLPPGATFDPVTLVFAWTPGFAQAGEYMVRFIAVDDGDGTGVPQATTVEVPITVNNANRPPVIVPFGNQAVARGEVVEIPLDISDPDNNPLEVVALNLPRFAQLVASGDGGWLLRIAPGDQDRGDYVVTMVATDDGDGGGVRMRQSDSYTFVITADSPSEAPLLAPIGDKVAVFGQTLRFTVRAADLDQDPLTFAVEGLPEGATLVPGVQYGTAIFEWTPTAAQAGEYSVTYPGHRQRQQRRRAGRQRCGDHSHRRARQQRRALAAAGRGPRGSRGRHADGATQRARPGRRPPDLQCQQPPARRAPGRDDRRADLLAEFLPGGCYNGIVLSVSDGHSTVTENIRITVTNTNRPPILAGLPTFGSQEDRLLSFSLVANDPDGDVMLYALTGFSRDGVMQPGTRPPGVFFNEINGLFQWTPNFDQAGEYVFFFRASDLHGAFDVLPVTVRIADVNRPPTLQVQNRQTALGVPLSFRVSGSDPDRDEVLRYSAVGLPEGATFDAMTGEFNWTPGAGQAGDYLVMVSVTDGKAVTSRPLVVRATLTPELPVAAIELTPSFAVIPGQAVTVTVLAEAFSGVTSRALFLNGQPVQLNAQHRAIISAPASGTHVLTAVVTDRDGLQTTVERILRVRDPADMAAPVVSFAPALAGARLTAATDIVARVADSNLDEWRLEIARAGSDEWVTLAGSRSTVDGVLLRLDPARFDTGFYQLRLSAVDIAGRAAEVTIDVELSAPVKAGQYLLEETDFSFVLGGHQLDFVRRYDSLTVAERGSFGHGWSLALRDVRVETDVPATGAEASGVFNPLRAGTRIYVTSPEGQRLGFTFTPVAQTGNGFAYWTPAWTADTNSGWQLQSVERKLQRGADRFYDLLTGDAYNPAAYLSERAQYSLVAPDGTRYEISAARGITGIVFADGVRLAVSDSGITGPDNESLRWIRDGNGAIRQVITPDGRVFTYGYDIDGNLASARDLEAATSVRYGYAEPQTHLLTVATRTGGGVAVSHGTTVDVRPITADLGAALSYLAGPRGATIAAGEVQLFSLATRDTEVLFPSGGAVLLGVIVQAAPGSTFVPEVPQLLGYSAIASRVEDGRAFALYRIDRPALDLLQVAGAGNGEYSIELFVAGDVNRDGRVDGTDAALLDELRRTGGYDPRADFDLDGFLDASDTQLLFASLGYTANLAPVIDTAERKTYVDLELNWQLDALISDPENDPVVVGLVSATNGTARIGGDGQTLYFMPDPGFVGTGTVTLFADDGYSQSEPISLSINVSDARLLSIDFQMRAPQLRAGDAWPVFIVGDFEDEAGVELPLSYVTLETLDPSIARMTARGELVAFGHGTTVLTATRGEITAATAVAAGFPDTPLEMWTYFFGIDAYPGSFALLPGESRQMVVEWGNGQRLDTAADGTRYFVGDSTVAEVSVDGRVVALRTGETTITVINRAGEQVVPLAVVAPSGGEIGSRGGVVVGADGQMIALGAGQVEDGTTVTITTLTEADLATELPSIVDFAAAFNVEVSGSRVDGSMQIAVPVGPEFQPGEQVLFFIEVETDMLGTTEKYWATIDAGIVGADGYARTTSPPWPGLSQNGNILMARANQPLRIVTIDLQNSWIIAQTLMLMGAATGSLAGFAAFSTAAVATVSFPLVLQADKIRTYVKFAEMTLELEIPIDAGVTNTRIQARIPEPPPSFSPTPVVTGADYDPIAGLLVLSGSEFGDNDMGAEEIRVAFRQGSESVFVEGIDLLEFGPTQLTLSVPPTVILGMAGIYVERASTRIPGVDLSEWASSQRVEVTNPGGYGFVGAGTQLAVIDLSLKQQGGVEEIVKAIELDGQTIVSTAVTNDLARVFAAVRPGGGKPAAIWVIDGVGLQRADATPETPSVDPIELPYGYTPTAMTIDPEGRYLYVAVQGAVVVIDLRPGSNLHRVVDVISLDTPTGKINAMALNSDGTRLYVTAPATEIYGGTKGWVQGGRDTGFVLVVNVDENDRPEIGARSNPQLWREVIAKLDGGLEPYGIKGTNIPDAMVFVSRLRGGAVSDYQGLQTIEVLNNDPTNFQVRIRTINLQLSNNTQQRFQLYIRNPIDVVVTQDRRYAFVLDWNLPLSVGSGDPGAMIEYMETKVLGSKVGIIEDPFGPAPRIVAATTPIPLAFATELQLSSDGQKLYAMYRNAGDILVFDVAAMTETISRMQAQGRLAELTRNPIDQLPNDPLPDKPVNLAPIPVVRDMRGFSIQPLDPLTLIAPLQSEVVHEPGSRLVFEWEVDTSRLGTEDFKVQVFLSALPPGEGLWPFDSPRSRIMLLEPSPSYAGEDLNPNRIWTSEILDRATSVELPIDADLLTAGQTYYWGVKLTAGEFVHYEAASFKAEPVAPQTPFSSVTILTHGIDFDFMPSVTNPPYQQPKEFMLLGQLIVDMSGGGVVLAYDKVTGLWVDLATGKVGIDALVPGKAVVLVSDWQKESDISDSGFSEAAAAAIYASLYDLNEKTGGNLFQSPMHFIGHGRGAVVNSEIVQRLGAWNWEVMDIHKTTLDPHDFAQSSLKVPIKATLKSVESSITFAQAVLAGISVVQPQLIPGTASFILQLQNIKSRIGTVLSWADRFGIALDIPWDDFKDPTVERWENIGFFDNYYQTNAKGLVQFDPLGAFSFPVFLDPLQAIRSSQAQVTLTQNGREIPGADFNVLMNGVAGFTSDDFKVSFPLFLPPIFNLPARWTFDFGFGGPHDRLLQWYAGTVNTGMLQFQNDPIYRRVTDEGLASRVLGLANPLQRFNDVPWYWTVPGLDMSLVSNPWAEPGAIWEGVTNGWYFSTGGGGFDNRWDTPPAALQFIRDSITYDNTRVTKGIEVVPTVFNGNFEHGTRQSMVNLMLAWLGDKNLLRKLFAGGTSGRFPLSYELPGWSFHGGEGFGVSVDGFGEIDFTGLFVFETNPTKIGADVLGNVVGIVIDKLFEKLVQPFISAAFARTFGVPTPPEPPSDGESPGARLYREWYELTWAPGTDNRKKFDAMEKLWQELDKKLTGIAGAGLGTLGLDEIFQFDPADKKPNPIGIQALKDYLKKAWQFLFKQMISGAKDSNFALMMGAGPGLAAVLEGLVELATSLGAPPDAPGMEGVGSVIGKLLSANLESVTSNRLIVPAESQDMPYLAFKVFKPISIEGSTSVEVRFKATAADAGDLVDSPPIPVLLTNGFFEASTYYVLVPPEFKGKMAEVEIRFVGLNTSTFIPFSPDDVQDPSNSIFDLTHIFFLDDVRFSKGIDLEITSPVEEGREAELFVSFAPADPSRPSTLFIDWGDGSPEERVELAPGTNSFTRIHVYEDDNPTGTPRDFTQVNVRSANAVGQSGFTWVDVLNVPPTIISLELSATEIEEGAELMLRGVFTDPGIRDTFKLTIDWGDGKEPQVFRDVMSTSPDGIASFTKFYRYADDNPTLTPQDSHRITVFLEDDDTGIDIDWIDVIVKNADPVIEELSLDVDSVKEGEAVTLTIRYFDRGVEDTLRAWITWPDGVTVEHELAVDPEGRGVFIVSHILEDDNPTGTPEDVGVVTVRIRDDDGGEVTDTIELTVANVEPTVTASFALPEIDEGDVAVLTVTIEDPGVRDTFQIFIDWGDGNGEEEHAGRLGAQTFEREFPDDFQAVVSVRVVDDDTGEGTAQAPLKVNNVAPTAQPSPDRAVTQGMDFTLRGGHSDPGVLDTHTYTWSIIDAGGVVVAGQVGEQPTFNIAAPGDYLVQLVVEDDDGGISEPAVSQLLVTELEFDWAIAVVGNFISEGDGSRLTVEIPFVADASIFKLNVDFGDGRVITNVPVPRSDVFTGFTHVVFEHVYANNPSPGQDQEFEIKVTLIYTPGPFRFELDTKDETVQVFNVAPRVEVEVIDPLQPGAPHILNATIIDPGVLDTHTILWEFSDGRREANVLSLTHVFGGPGNVIVTVTDSDGDSTQEIILVDSPLATAATGPGGFAPLTLGEVAPLANRAESLWLLAGADIAPLAGATFEIMDLPGALLALVSVQEWGVRILLDVDAAGFGWFVDPTPAFSEEFDRILSAEARQATTGPAAGRVDLLTVLAHEFGHVLGLSHIDSSVSAFSVMLDDLPLGTRRVPVAADLVRAAGGSILNGSFSISDPAFYEFGWQAGGSAFVADGEGVLVEDPFRASRLSQSFRLPYDVERLQFTITGGQMAPIAGLPQDAFEVALLRPDTFESLVGTIALSNSDAFFNLQADGSFYTGAGVTVTDLAGNLLTSIDFSQPVTVSVDIRALAGATDVALYFDLLGFGALDSVVRIDDVRLVGSATENRPPVARDDSATVAEDSWVLVDVLANDTDPDGDFISLFSVGLPANGSAVIENGRIRYTPSADYFGSDSFSYTIVDSAGNQASATVSVTVQPVNDPPVLAEIQDYSIVEGVAFAITAEAFDIEGDLLTFRLDQAPAGASIDPVTGRIEWLAAGIGTEVLFVVTVDDGQAQDSRSFRVTVLAPGGENRAPIAANDTAFVLQGGSVLVDVLANDLDPDGDPLVLLSVGAAGHGVVVIEDGRVRYTPEAGFVGADSFSYVVGDGRGGEATAQVFVEVRAEPVGENRPPVALDDAASVAEDGSILVDVLANDSDPDGDPLLILEISAPTHGVAVIEDNRIRYTPSPNYFGSDALVYRIGDGRGGEATARLVITVTPVNDPPVATDDLVSVPEDGTVLIDVLANDSDLDGDPLTIIAVTAPSHGTTVIENGRIRYTPAPDYHGPDSFEYTISDPSGATATATVRVTVTPVNDAPQLAPIPDVRIDNGVLLSVQLLGTDVDGDPLTYVLLAGPAGATLDSSTGLLRWIAAGPGSTTQFTVAVRDPAGAEAARSFSVTVRLPAVDGPVIVDPPIPPRPGLPGLREDYIFLNALPPPAELRSLQVSANALPAPLDIGHLFMPTVSGGSGRTADEIRLAPGVDPIRVVPPAGRDPRLGLRVETLAATPDGFALRFTQRVDLASLAPGQGEAAADAVPEVLLIAADGRPVAGTIIMDADGRGFRFVAEGVLAGGVYQVILKSGVDAVHSFFGKLDGDGDGIPGGDHVAEWEVGVPGANLHEDGVPGTPVAAPDDGEAPRIDLERAFAGFALAGGLVFGAASRGAPRARDRRWQADLLSGTAREQVPENRTLRIELDPQSPREPGSGA
jgi:hypothetical protein